MKGIIHFYQRTIYIYLIILISLPVMGQENRTYNGSNNNIQSPHFGAVGTNQLQLASNGYSDSIAELGGVDRPNPRFISNVIFNQDGLVPDIMELSDYAWVWGQFIDHDITLVVDDPNETADIAVPEGDPYFDPNNTGTAVIGMHRSAYDPNSGISSSNPRAFPNGISSFIDASVVYGSDFDRANWLRTFQGGALKTSSGNLLPYNTISGELEGNVDSNAPKMAMPFPFVNKWFVAGDVRANENPLLTSFHTIFLREHNRLCKIIATNNPQWIDEEIYQKARKFVGALMQAVVYEEWLPTLGVELTPYSDYNDQLEVGIMNIFSAAAYRYGHTVINSTLIRMDNNGNILPQGNILLRDAFFNPTVISEVGGIAPYLKGMATQVEQEFDCKMIHDLRNFLFGIPGSGGLDLAAMNINRGRERGLPDYNTARADFGMAKVESFASFTSDPWFNQTLESTYEDINNIDAWVGFLAEDHMSNALFGESVMKIMEKQFTMLRDGDRFYYVIDSGLSSSEITDIKNTRLYDIIQRNSSINGIQENIFVAREHNSTSVVNSSPQVDFDVFPNPTAGRSFINFESTSSSLGYLYISDLYGQLIHAQELDISSGMNTFEFDLSNDLTTSIYIVSLKIGSKLSHQRIIKN